MGEESAFLQASKKLLCSQAGKSCVLCSLENTHFFAYTIYWKRKNSLAQQVCNYKESGKVNSSDGFESKLSKICLRKTLKGCLFVPRELFVYLSLKMKNEKGKRKTSSRLRAYTLKPNKKQCSELQVSLCLLSVGAPLSENPSKHVLPKSLEIRIIRAFP